MEQKHLRTLAAGEVLFREGDPGNACFVVLSGAVDITRGASGLTVARLGAGEIVGELAVIDGEVRSATVTSAAPGTSVLVIDQAHFIYLVGHEPAFALAILETLSRRLRLQNLSTGHPGEASTTPPHVAVRQGSASRDPEKLVVEVAPRITLFSASGRSCNAVLLRGSSKNVLADTGLPTAKPVLMDCLGQVGLTPHDIDMVVLTHEHVDHVGCVSLFAGRSIIACHRLTASKIMQQDENAIRTKGFVDSRDAFKVDLWLTENTVIDLGDLRLTVLHTPGHTSGSISLYETRNRVLICGDTVLSGGHMGGIFASGSISDYLQSLEMLAALPARILIPGHGPPSSDPATDIAHAMATGRRLLSETLALSAALTTREGFNRMSDNTADLNKFYG